MSAVESRSTRSTGRWCCRRDHRSTTIASASLRARSGSFASSSSLSSPPATQFAVKNERVNRHALRAQNDDENDENTSSLSTSLAKSLAEELCSLSVGAADASNGSFMERKKALEKALLMASLLEEAEAEVNDVKKTRKTSTMTVKTTKAEIERELVNHDVLGHYLNEIARFAYIRKTSHSGAVSRKRRRAKRPKDRVSNQKKPRQGLTRQDMRKEHRRWCLA